MTPSCKPEISPAFCVLLVIIYVNMHIFFHNCMDLITVSVLMNGICILIETVFALRMFSQGHALTWWTIVVTLIHLTQAAFPDWLVTKVTTRTRFIKTQSGTIRLTNGLISREFTTTPDFATVDYYSYEKQSSLLRAIGPEATLALDGMYFNIGGLLTTIPRAYLNRTALAEDIHVDPEAFHYVSYSVKKPVAPYEYRPRRFAPNDLKWPPPGLRLDVNFKAPWWASYEHHLVMVTVHYEMYDSIPLLSKWISVRVDPSVDVSVRVISVEQLAVNQQWAEPVGYRWLDMQTDQSHGTVVTWDVDLAAKLMPGSFQPIVSCQYTLLPTLGIPIGRDGFESFRVHQLVAATSDRERLGLARHRMLRLLAPQVQENPIFAHSIYSDSRRFRALIDQLAEVGFEMAIYSFGSGFNIESSNDTYIKQIAADVAYAKSKGIEVGGYDLIALTRDVKPAWSAGSGNTCFASGWYDFLLNTMLRFMERTGLSAVETDGPYGGYTCDSQTHRYHRGRNDSVYQQQRLQGKFFEVLQARGVFINQPDYFFYQGGTKTGMGYNEHQYSLPRWQDITISRQGFYDDTFRLPPTTGWMFVPLVDYHGGGSAAEFEPFSDHKTEYEWALAQYFGAGIGAAYRGYRLYDTNETKAIVKKWVSFYHAYRDILTSDIVHVRRADMQDVDAFMHVNPHLRRKALAMMFNPTQQWRQRNITLPLYYSGLTDVARVSEQGRHPATIHILSRDYSIEVPLDLPPLGITWFVIW